MLGRFREHVALRTPHRSPLAPLSVGASRKGPDKEADLRRLAYMMRATDSLRAIRRPLVAIHKLHPQTRPLATTRHTSPPLHCAGLGVCMRMRRCRPT